MAGVEITVIDDAGVTGWLASATRTGEVYMSDVKSMVSNVLTEAGTSLISRLNILDHGNASGVQIGRDWVDVYRFSSFEAYFLLLRGRFTNAGFVHLQHCKIGNNHTLMTQFAQAFGVTVYAGTGLHNPIYRVNYDGYDFCTPQGVCGRDVGRPPALWATLASSAGKAALSK